MKIILDSELMNILLEIISEEKTEKEWALIESCDMFQTQHYNGGYDADEEAFCFSYYDDLGKEYWFQFSLSEIDLIIQKKIIKLRPADV